MLRLLVVDDEDIITDGLYEVFQQWMPDKLDVCKAYSGKEALNWLKRTRIDIVLTDISMPGMSGLELSDEIQMYWPRCKIIFLTGYSEFQYAYKAIQMSNVRYLLKTEGYAKVTEVVQEVIQEIHQNNQLSALVEQSREQVDALEFMAQGEYIRHLVQKSHLLCQDEEVLVKEFGKLNLNLNPLIPVVMVVGHLSYPDEATYSDRSEIVHSTRMIWHSYLSKQTRHIGIVDKHGDMLWLLQPSEHVEERLYNHLLRYLEGTLELIQETCLESLGLTIAFTISGASCEWGAVTQQYERLRQLHQMTIADGLSIILMDRMEQPDPSNRKEDGMLAQKKELMEAYLEAGRKDKFYEVMEDITASMLHPTAHVHRTIECYYSIALVLLSSINRGGLYHQIGEYGKLMRLDEHSSMKEGIAYLHAIAERLFKAKHNGEFERATSVIDRICRYIEEHLSEDLSLVRLAEINYFNPSYLSRFFKQERGVNLSEYIDNCRLKKARELLRNGELKIREVSSAVGYEAAHSFTRFFKKATGITPQEYRDTVPAVINENERTRRI
ncbi:DNA-binding response regulator [Paenibacillus sp. BIHB 4019]|uniref:DNA-binding response regulator n=1 Tax=Paenibacillus sp. BIHB 4019 TaxID=1870819 RepID=A0A1B2DLS4_9BACL|nr:response regulator [Paenibacillus sp. BIHB 4019]ANY68651.1 DNA-binding response regulator [Paenibacillus sp. BIHB 4019]